MLEALAAIFAGHPLALLYPFLPLSPNVWHGTGVLRLRRRAFHPLLGKTGTFKPDFCKKRKTLRKPAQSGISQ
jgi:hypothetical protein